MTRAEFITAYLKAREGTLLWGTPVSALVRTENGFEVPTSSSNPKPWRWVATECSCGESECEGWAMVPEEWLPFHQEIEQMHKRRSDRDA